MAKIVELCGSPGVGKSTIFKEICKINKKKDNWTTASNTNPKGEESISDFVRKISIEIINGKTESNNNETYLTFVKKIYRKIRSGRNYIDNEILKAAGERFVASYPDYIEACWSNIMNKQRKSTNGMDLRFEKTEWIYRIIKKIQIVRENNTFKPVIIDEGLVNMIDRALYKSKNYVDEEIEIRKIINSIPLPNAIVYIESDLKENIERLKKRKDIRDMHKNLPDDNLKIATEICRRRLNTTINQLKIEKGIPILYINSSNKINNNVDLIIDFTENLAKNTQV